MIAVTGTVISVVPTIFAPFSLRRATYKLVNSNVVLWTPRLYAFYGWKNTLVEENQDITEENITQYDKCFFKDLSDIRFVFARRRVVVVAILSMMVCSLAALGYNSRISMEKEKIEVEANSNFNQL